MFLQDNMLGCINILAFNKAYYEEVNYNFKFEYQFYDKMLIKN
jgi:hypothetical protein